MKNFKTFYSETFNSQTDESVGDVFGDISSALKSKVKDTMKAALNKTVPKGIQNLAGRLFNVENDITNLIDKNQYSELGQLLKDKRIPPTMTFVRYKDTTGNRYEKFPLMFVIYDRIVFKQKGKIQQAFLDIERGLMSDIDKYFSPIFENNDMITHYLMQPKVYNNPSLVSRMSDSIPILINFGYPIIKYAPNIISTSFRTKTPSVFKAIVTSKKVKLDSDINDIINRYVNGDDAQQYKEFKSIVQSNKYGVSGYMDKSSTAKSSAEYDAEKELRALNYDMKGRSEMQITYDEGRKILSALVAYAGIGDIIPKTSIYTRPASDIEYYINQIGSVLGRTGKVKIKK